jgi:citrate synthase
MADKPSTGLADIIAASTALSDIDGRAGLPSYRGYGIDQRAGSATSGEIACLPQRGHLIRLDRGLTRAPLERR